MCGLSDVAFSLERSLCTLDFLTAAPQFAPLPLPYFRSALSFDPAEG